MKITAHNLDVEVTHTIEIGTASSLAVPGASQSQSNPSNGLTIIKIQAMCGQTTHGHTVTVGAVDGTRPAPPTATELQKMLDDGRNHAANEAAWKENVRVASTQIS